MARLVPSPQALRHLARLCAPNATGQRCLATGALHCDRQAVTLQTTTQRRRLTTSPHRRQQSSSTTTSRDTQTSPSPDSNPNASNATPATPLPDTSTLYTLFPSTLPSGPPPAGPFTIPLPSLRREFLQLQSQYHPDKAPPSTPLHRQNLALSSLINNAYITLSSPLLRAQYLLQELHDIDVTSEDNKENETDQATLMEVMEAQEAVEEARDETEVEALKDENNVRIRETEKEMESAFEREDVQGAKRECLRLKYWMSLDGVLRDWEPGKEVRLVH